MKKAKNPVIYITRDRERAEGMPQKDGYFIISGNEKESTYDLLRDSKIEKGSSILVFKNNLEIERLAREKELNLLNPPASLSEKIENKITQVEWLGELSRFLPNHKIILTKKIEWNKKPFIIQWAHSHTGDGTFLMGKEVELDQLKKKFPDREARVSEYIIGPVFTVNIIVSKKATFVGNISYQITGTLPFTENPFSTIGNDWSLPHSIMSENKIKEFKNIANLVGDKMRESGWKGLFGIDVIYDESQDKLFLIEINARQPASTTFESQLQLEMRKGGASGITVFEAHLSSLLDETLKQNLIEINDGAQIIQRVTKNTKNLDSSKLEKSGYQVIKYENIKLNTDLLRIQSHKGIMETHNKFNSRGKKIVDMLSFD